ncbi:hypothetical protein [Breoghania sp.]|nr:hypothetical protein [Breoghania sp.]
MQAFLGFRRRRARQAHRDVFAHFARTLEHMLTRPEAKPGHGPRVRRALP